jgi:hypothetical protein
MTKASKLTKLSSSSHESFGSIESFTSLVMQGTAVRHERSHVVPASRRHQPLTPHAIPFRKSVVNPLLSHAPWKIAGVPSSFGRPAREAGLWQ